MSDLDDASLERKLKIESEQCMGNFNWSPPDYAKARQFFEFLKKLDLQYEEKTGKGIPFTTERETK